MIAPDRTPPGAPRDVTVAADTLSVRISWKPPSDDGGAVLTKYSVAAEEAPQHACEVPSTDSSCMITGLSAEIAYTFTVRAHNRKGAGPASEPSLPVTPFMGFPGQPQNVAARAGNLQITVSWRPPFSTGGGALTGYLASVERAGDTAQTCVAGPADTSCVITGLLNDSAYQVTVRAGNAAGKSLSALAPDSVYPSRYAVWTQSLVMTSVNGIDAAGNQFVATGSFGGLQTSFDGSNWEARNTGSNLGIRSAAGGNGLLVAVGSNGTLRTSPDGVVWTARTSTLDATWILRKIIWNGTLFVVAGGTASEISGVILTSPNGTTWSNREPGTHGGVLMSVAWAPYYTVTPGAGLSIAVGAGGMIRTSPDGVTWTTRTSGTTARLRDVTWGTPASAGATGLRVAVGDGGTVLTSTNGVDWSMRQVGNLSIKGVTWTGTHFVALAWDPATFGQTICHSADGVTWRTTRTDHNFGDRLVSAGGGRVLAVGGAGVLSNP